MKRVRVQRPEYLFLVLQLETLANVRELVNQSIWFTDACAPNRKQDTTEEYPKGRNSCLVLNLLICVSSITFAKQIRYKLDTKTLQAITHLEFRIYFNHLGYLRVSGYLCGYKRISTDKQDILDGYHYGYL